MSTCVVPGCINLLQERMTYFPRAARLANRWLNAIEVGTGRAVQPTQQEEARICNMHFAVPSQTTTEDEYCEPSLFFRDSVLIQIASCELCYKFDMVDDMYKLSERISSGDKETLYALARKYFHFPKKSFKAGQYFCESCVITIDMTHSFWRKTEAAWNVYRKELKLMAQEKIVFRSNDSFLNNPNGVLVQIQQSQPICLDSSDSDDDDDGVEEVHPSREEEVMDADLNNDAVEEFDDIIVKEEALLDFPVSSVQRPVSTPQVNANKTYKCYICNISFQDKTILAEHINKMHVGKYKRACKNCNQSFVSALLLNQHMATHKPYRCNYCPLEFAERREVIFHEVQQHAKANKKKS